MELLKIVGIGVIICVTIIVVKQVRPEFAAILTILGSCFMLVYCLKFLVEPFNTLNSIIFKTGIDSELFSIILKIVGVGYLIEFGASICLDTGNTAIAEKVILGGKILILILSIPILTSIFDVVLGLIP